ncbi:MAG TPA: aminotransferase class I/II-fold pyridoxal phosphate-dependent enzyme [Candidatus Limnocylindria bacterium]
MGRISDALLPAPAGTDAAGLVDLTQHELLGLRTQFNLADAHTHQGQSPSQRRILERLPDLWDEAAQLRQHEIEERFLEAFFRLHEQPAALAIRRSLLSYSASTSMSVIAVYLAAQRLSVSLIEPTFDNLPNLLRMHGVAVSPTPEDVFADPVTLRDRLDDHESDVLYLVDPNNPTGSTLFHDGGKVFEQLLVHCSERALLLVLDFCFASFALRQTHRRGDVYRQLEESGVSYMAIEDTGKTWPMQDAKCAVLTVSADLYREIFDLHTTVLLNVSPFVLNVVTEYVRDSRSDGLASVLNVQNTNRDQLSACVQGTDLRLSAPQVDTSVAWLRLGSRAPLASVLQHRLREHGLYVLPGTYFYWADQAAGERNLRVALARDSTMFAAAMRRLRELLLDPTVMS